MLSWLVAVTHPKGLQGLMLYSIQSTCDTVVAGVLQGGAGGFEKHSRWFWLTEGLGFQCMDKCQC